MQYKKKLIVVAGMVVLIAILQVALANSTVFSVLFADYVFVPFQSLRNFIFGWSPVSFGDVLYFCGGVAIVVLLARWIYYLVTIKKNGQRLVKSFVNTLVTVVVVYFIFMIGWGGNYYKPSLAKYWGMDKDKWRDTAGVVHYEQYLVSKLNEYAPQYQPQTFKEVRRDAMHYYKEHTDCKARLNGLNIKPSLYGFMMQYLGIQGYYNPITGEAQMNRFLPTYMLPFVVVHEIAHQAGIAAEDDANLLAYTISMKSENKTFLYSAYLNMWLYNHYRLRMKDSTTADNMKAQLNDLTIQHIDTLRQIRERYRGDLSKYSSDMYDTYLKMLQQEQGIKSYNRATITAWIWEQTDSIRRKEVIDIP